MKKFTKELGPGWITLVENDDYALSRLIFGDGLEVDADEEETPLLKKGFQQIQEYWTGHRVIFTLPLAPGGSDFEREVWETVIRIPYGEHFTTPTLLAALALEDTEENRTRVIKAVDDYQDLLRLSVASAGNDQRHVQHPRRHQRNGNALGLHGQHKIRPGFIKALGQNPAHALSRVAIAHDVRGI